MSKSRFVKTNFWSDPWVVDELNPLDRYLFLYFITNEKTNLAGVYEVSLRTISNETGLEKEELIRMMRRLEPRIRYENGWVVMMNFIKHQNYRNIKINKGIVDELMRVPPAVLQHITLPEDYVSSISHASNMHETLHLIQSNLIQLNLIKSNVGSDVSHPTAAKADLKKVDDKKAKQPVESEAFKNSDVKLKTKELQAGRRKESPTEFKKARKAADIAREKLRAKGLAV